MAKTAVEPKYDKELVDLLYVATTATDGIPDATRLIDAGYVTIRPDGKWSASGKALSFLYADYPVLVEQIPNDDKAFFADYSTEYALEGVARHIEEGYLICIGGTYHITERGYRIAARSLGRWLTCKDKDESPPAYIELLDIDGCTNATLGAANLRRSSRGQYYWRHLNKRIIESLSPEDIAVLRKSCGVSNESKPKLPGWCPDLIAEAVKDGQECLENVNHLSSKTWGVLARQVEAKL